MSGDVHVRFCESRGVRFPPATHLVVLTKHRVEARAADALVRQILADMGLQVAEEKSGVRRMTEGFEFLGFSVVGRYLRPRPNALNAFKDRVRNLTRRQAPVSLPHMIQDLNPVLGGWGTYFALGDVVGLFEDLDGWIRMRLRSKVRGSKARSVSNSIMPNHELRTLGLVSLETIVRARRLSPAPGRSLG